MCNQIFSNWPSSLENRPLFLAPPMFELSNTGAWQVEIWDLTFYWVSLIQPFRILNVQAPCWHSKNSIFLIRRIIWIELHFNCENPQVWIPTSWTCWPCWSFSLFYIYIIYLFSHKLLHIQKHMDALILLCILLFINFLSIHLWISCDLTSQNIFMEFRIPFL